MIRHIKHPVFVCSALLFALGAASGFSEVIFRGALGSAVPIYGSSEVKNRNKQLRNEHYNRIVLSMEGETGIALAEPVLFTVGATSVMDFNFSGSEHCNYIDFALYSGFRIYPGLKGFSITAEYALGNRTDFIDIKEIDKTESTSWGNGFRFTAEYNFAYQTKKIAPVLGMAWRRMPRGKNVADNYLSIYISFGRGA